ncbi:hypothetical protein V3C99_005213 [Haemonchus contortus]|uniref:Uncharacterized protein n=1 Tax=Haemonchus contortus TaxID=6289 RepID=A0A7I5E5M2_HAECO
MSVVKGGSPKWFTEIKVLESETIPVIALDLCVQLLLRKKTVSEGNLRETVQILLRKLTPETVKDIREAWRRLATQQHRALPAEVDVEIHKGTGKERERIPKKHGSMILKRLNSAS